MNNQEAKFILEAYRPNGGDADDATFAAAIAQAQRDPELRAWWERQRTFDASVAGKLKEIAPPVGLRDSILAGVRASRPRRQWWSNPAWFAAAAVVTVLALAMFSLRTSSGQGGVGELANAALSDMIEAHHQHSGRPSQLAGVQQQLARMSLPLTNLKLDLDELREKKCRTIRVGGREVFEFCFERDGTWFHLYAGRREDFEQSGVEPKSFLKSRDGFAATAWTDAKYVYAIVTSDGVEALHRVI
jgi:anti-sigma factor RsiW